MKRYLKSALKWGGIFGGLYVFAQLFSGLDFETRTGWLIFGLGMVVAYADGTAKDRATDLETRIERLERQIYGPHGGSAGVEDSV